jgi:hypothetical protein
MCYGLYTRLKKERGEGPAYPSKTYAFIAYKDKEFKEFSTREEAEKFSKLIEKVQINKEEYDEQLSLYNKFQSDLYNDWHSEIRQHFDDLNDAQFGVVYDAGYDRGHSSGYDEVFGCMVDFCNFANEFMRASQA